MEKKGKEPIKLKNKYTGEIVYTKDYEDTRFLDGITFLQVYNQNQPNRTYLANKDSFTKIF